ncbi:MAG: glycine--tRNA ligase [Parcubacteria group bacterium GW2011_GWA2_38_13b]|nr:MAG: glycine--tRNA ligase [Parcubacteria group bacterium GW2011_GWA2_38_13b]
MHNHSDGKIQKLISLCKRRGIIFQSSEIYGGAAAAYDYGPLGVEIKNIIKKLWWKEMVYDNDNIVGLDSAILMHPKVWEASGHVENFEDILVECKECHRRFKKDDLKEGKCPECGGVLTEPKKFNPMFETNLGPVRDSASKVYLRPETAQGIYVNFNTVQKSMRRKIPFGIAQIGKAFRNEITPGNFIFRTVEFEQAEQQFFIKPEEDEKWFEYWKEKRMNWHLSLGIKKENLRFKKHEKLAHYAKAGADIEYNFPMRWDEIEGIHNRGDWDLSRHSKFSGNDLSYFNDETKQKFLPFIIETSMGIDRTMLAVLLDAFEEMETRSGKDDTKHEMETVLRLHPKIAPVKAAVFPLVKNKPEIVKKAREIYENLKKYWFVQYDETGAIGRRYRRQDEIGTPFCVTVDFDTLENETVTVRHRDTMEQERIKIAEIEEFLRGKLA